MSREILPEPVLAMVKVSTIGWASASGRTGNEKDLAIDELAQSLGSGGQIDPIIIISLPRPVDGCFYEGVDGYRRCLAAVKLDVDKLQALIYPTTCAGRADEIRAAAIVQSLPHSDVEKALMVGALVDEELAKVGNNLATATENVAGRLNKPARFVSDYRYLTRLTRSARELLVQRRLTLAQARELACISDPELQDEIADEAASNQDGGFGRDLGWVQRRCRDARRNLKVIAWDASVSFAGKPACTTCPSNTANDGMLYEHDRPQAKFLGDMAEERSGLGLCVNPKCFQHKADAAEQARESLAKKAKTEMKKLAGTGYSNDPGEAARRVVERERAGGGLAAKLKDTIAMRSAREAAEAAAPKATGESSGPKSQPTAEKKASKLDSVRTVEQKAKERFDAAHEQWMTGLVDALITQVLKFPGGYSGLAALVYSGRLDCITLRYQGEDAERKMAVVCQSPSTREKLEPFKVLMDGCAKLVDGKVGAPTAALHTLEKEAAKVAERIDPEWRFDLGDVARAGVLMLLQMAGGTYPAEPKLETFLAEAGVGVGNKPGVSDEDVKRVEGGLAAEWDQVKKSAGKKVKGKKAKAGVGEPAMAGAGAGVGVGGGA